MTLNKKGQDGIDGYGPSGPKGDKVPELYIHKFTEKSEKLYEKLHMNIYYFLFSGI